MSALGLKILLVEDDSSIRETLTDLLVAEGYEVSAAERAEHGLELLSHHRFDLLLTDYALPGLTGTQMVSSARAQGLLNGTPVLVVTAHPTIDNPLSLEVIKKPLDVDQFLGRIAELVAPARGRLVNATRDWLSSYSDRSLAVSNPVELVLYISAYSPSSLKALRNVQRLLQKFDARHLTFTICDLSKEPAEAGEADKIAFTPTLVKRWPEPRTWILGDLENTQVLEDLLTHSGVELAK
ncbi:MAG: response regulator [Myxococcaceae bacterium]